MKLTDLFFKKPPPPQKSLPEIHRPEVPEGSTVVLEEIHHAEVLGHPEMTFKSHERVYMGEDGRKCKITITNTIQASGCGHNISNPADVGFISHISKLPVCKICEAEYYRLREQTRHEKCVCRHLVAPHELTYLEGKGFVCEDCKKKEEKVTPKKISKWIWKTILKPIVINDSPANEGIPNELHQHTIPRNRPPFSND